MSGISLTAPARRFPISGRNCGGCSTDRGGARLFRREQFEARLRTFAALVAKIPADACLLVAHDGLGWEDIYYLTGFAGSSGVLLVPNRGDPQLIVDPRYIEAAGAKSCCRTLSCTEVRRRSPLQAALHVLLGMRHERVAYGGHFIPHATYRYIEQEIGRAAEFVDVSNLLSNLRRRKSEAEVAAISTAACIAGRAFARSVSEAAAGMSEREFAGRLTYYMMREGADFLDPMPVMAASGERTAQPHFYPSERRFAPGDLIMVDFGARVEGYVCDVTRMISVGEPTERVKSYHAILLWAQAEAATLLKPGKSAREVDAAARSVMENAGVGDLFIHGIGHGIGLRVHEPPSLNVSSDAVLAEGDVVTIEPGFYRPGQCGMRVEDDYLVTSKGARRLTADFENELYRI